MTQGRDRDGAARDARRDRLEDDAAAAHAGLTRDADAASAALHAHGEHKATQIVTDADRVADAVYRGTR